MCPEQISDGRGEAFMLAINQDGSINVSGINVAIGSLALTLEDVFIVSGNAWDGIGSVYITNTLSVTTGSESYIPAGSVQINNFPISYPGSVSQLTNPWITLGSTQITNDILSISGIVNTQLYAGSNSYIPAGSVIITNVVGVSGNLGVIFDNDYLSVIQSGTQWLTLGSVVITNIVPISGAITINDLATAGSLSTQGVVGSVDVTNFPITYPGSVSQVTNPWIISGNVLVSGTVTTGSENYIKAGSVIITNTVPVSGNILISGTINTGLYAGSSVWQGTSPWIVLGSTAITNIVSISGAITVNNLSTAGSLSTQNIIGSVAVSNLSYTNNELIRVNSGSPASWITFSNNYNSLLIENLGSTSIYYAFKNVVNVAGSSYSTLSGGEGESMDLTLGSFSLQSSGTSISVVQIQGIW